MAHNPGGWEMPKAQPQERTRKLSSIQLAAMILGGLITGSVLVAGTGADLKELFSRDEASSVAEPSTRPDANFSPSNSTVVPDPRGESQRQVDSQGESARAELAGSIVEGCLDAEDLRRLLSLMEKDRLTAEQALALAAAVKCDRERAIFRAVGKTPPHQSHRGIGFEEAITLLARDGDEPVRIALAKAIESNFASTALEELGKAEAAWRRREMPDRLTAMYTWGIEREISERPIPPGP